MEEGNSCPHIEISELVHAQTLVYHHVFNRCGTMSIASALELGIPDVIDRIGGGSRPVTLPELAAALPEVIHESKLPYLSRLMRLLVQLEFLGMKGDEGYVLTPFSKLLMKSNPNGMSSFYLGQIHPTLWTPWLHLSDWFKGGDPATTTFQMAHGKKVWEFLVENPDLADLFNHSMASDSTLLMDIVLRECGDIFQGISSLVDLGGGAGIAAAAISEAFPGVKCTVLDLPHAMAAAAATKVDFVAGDMFQHVPSADAIFLKNILHDWDDENCIKILKRCKEALPPSGGKLIVLDMILKRSNGDRKATEAQLFLDAVMMMAHAGKERDEQEWRKIFTEAGFTRFKIKHDIGIRSLMEIYP